jgi:sulfur relay (sulfurtransferase) complex TusBCD TusD component (DsrE family)
MKVAILLKSGPCTNEAERAFLTAADLLAQGYSVSLFLLQEAVRLSGPPVGGPTSPSLQELFGQDLDVYVLTRDAVLRGLTEPPVYPEISGATYDSLVDIMDSSDRVIGLL